MKAPRMDDDGAHLDSPAAFAIAGESLAVLCKYAISPDRAAELLSKLAQSGLIVSVELHDEVCDGYAAELNHAHGAADDLVRRLEEGDRL